MMTVYTTSEVYDIGIAIEKNGARFYEEAAAVQQDPELANFFTALASLENDHVALWEGLKERFAESPQPASPGDPDDRAQITSEVTIAPPVFAKNVDVLSQVLRCETVKDVLKLALAFEKETVDFYQALSETPPSKRDKEKIDDLIREEQRHVAMIQERLDLLG